MRAMITSLLVSLCAGIAMASPLPEVLPEGFEPIAAEEVRARMADSNHSIEKRQVGGIYLCTGANYSGTCGYKVQPVCYSGQCSTRSDIANHCVTLTSPYLRNIGSFGPDSGANVYISINGDCNEASGSIAYPGSGNFRNYQLEDGQGAGGRITTFLVVAS